MKAGRSIRAGMGLMVIIWGLVLSGPACLADDPAGGRPKTRIELQLSEDFYRALRAEGAKSYDTGQSDEYLRQIAVSARFIVETNLKLIQQQERMIELLEAKQKPK